MRIDLFVEGVMFCLGNKICLFVDVALFPIVIISTCAASVRNHNGTKRAVFLL